jgi:hypothetical protein
MQQSESIKTLAPAFIKAQKAVEGAEKNKANPGFKGYALRRPFQRGGGLQGSTQQQRHCDTSKRPCRLNPASYN